MSFRDKTVSVGIGGVDLVPKEGGTGGLCTPSEIGCVRENPGKRALLGLQELRYSCFLKGDLNASTIPPRCCVCPWGMCEVPEELEILTEMR